MVDIPFIGRSAARVALPAIFAFTLSAATSPSAAQDIEKVVRGRVFRADSTPLGGAAVIATSSDGRETRTAKTDRNGIYEFRLGRAGRSYSVLARQIGFSAVRVDAVVPASGGFLVDFFLTPLSLQKVTVVGKPRRKARAQDGFGENRSGSERSAGVESQVLGATEMSPIALAAASPGAIAAGDGFSVLGLSPELNSVTLNGMEFAGGTLPRGLSGYSRMASANYDVSRGGFGGAQVSVRSFSGSNLSNRDLHLTIDHPALQAGSGAHQPSASFQDIQISGTASGPILFDSSYYSVAVQLGTRSRAAVSLDGANPQLFDAFLVPRDSAQRLQNVLRNVGLLRSNVAGEHSASVMNASFFGRIDVLRPFDRTINVTAGLNVADDDGRRYDPFAANSTVVRERALAAYAQAAYTRYFFTSVLNESRFAVNVAGRRSEPTSLLPTAQIALSSGMAALQTSQLAMAGGNPNGPGKTISATLQLLNESSWYSASGHHRFKLTGGTLIENLAVERHFNERGAFLFPSIEAFELGRPTVFTRRSVVQSDPVNVFTAYTALGDAWQPRVGLNFQLGIRADVDGVVSRPLANVLVGQLFSESTSRVPVSLAISPRAGFVWAYGRSNASADPTGTVRGGVGAFRSRFRAAQIAPIMVHGSDAGAPRELNCVGASAPTPQWSSYDDQGANIPSQCSGPSSTPSGLASVNSLDRNYQPLQSWRANLGWAGRVLKFFDLAVDATLSLGVHASSMVDLNLKALPSTFLASEAGRGVFAPAEAIDPSSGIIPVAATRNRDGMGMVLKRTSDLRTIGSSISATITPYQLSRQQVYLNYTYGRSSAQTRGFEATTAGDPRKIEWSRSSFERRHQLTLGGTFALPANVALDAYVRLQSGTPYTPLVAGDINGDGLSNDRAFVFSPTSSGELADAMAAVLRGRDAARCLGWQIGRIAGQNSCTGPWEATAGAELRIPAGSFHLPERMELSLFVVNIPAGLDQLVHGSQTQGWGQTSWPDATLLRVTGFDRQNLKYTYAVNPHFGRADARQQIDANLFRATLNVRLAIGVDPDKQILGEQLRRVAAIPGAPEQVRIRDYFAGRMPNIGLAVSRMKDSLALSAEQLGKISTFSDAYDKEQHELWDSLAAYLVKLQLDYTSQEAVGRYRETNTAAYRSAGRYGRRIREVLTDSQVRRLSLGLRRYFDEAAVMELMKARF